MMLLELQFNLFYQLLYLLLTDIVLYVLLQGFTGTNGVTGVTGPQV